jgi:ornithine cyclodeaminase/alanine dehydrogenase-like protein (mu-crystallin family)
VLFLTEADVRALLPMEKAIELVEHGFLHQAQGTALNHPRRRLQLNSSAMLHYMAAADLASGYIGVKVYTTHPQTGAHFLVLLFASDGRPLAVIEANALGQIRTGAATAVATRRLALPDAAIVGLIGSGFQARSQLEAVARVRPVREVRVFSRSPDNRRRFAEEMAGSLGLPVTPVDSAEQAIRGCQIAITATTARDPVLLGEWLSEGTHVNAVGSNHARRRELDASAVNRASVVVVDSIEQARMESGDLLAAYGPDGAAWNQVIELADVLSGKAPSRTSASQITLFKSNGLALEDIAVAGHVYKSAILSRDFPSRDQRERI